MLLLVVACRNVVAGLHCLTDVVVLSEIDQQPVAKSSQALDQLSHFQDPLACRVSLGVFHIQTNIQTYQGVTSTTKQAKQASKLSGPHDLGGCQELIAGRQRRTSRKMMTGHRG